MGYTLDQILGRGVRKRLVGLVRDQAGMVPGEDLIDLHSVDAFLGLGLARRAPNWHIVANDPLPEEEREAPGNWEHRAIDLPKLPFPDDGLAAIVGAFLEAPFEPWSKTLAEEACRVLAPKGRVLLLVRRPSPRTPDLDPGLPAEAVDQLEAAGLNRTSEGRQLHLLDGSEVHLLEGTGR